MKFHIRIPIKIRSSDYFGTNDEFVDNITFDVLADSPTDAILRANKAIQDMVGANVSGGPDTTE